jgi:hypothetical protein
MYMPEFQTLMGSWGLRPRASPQVGMDRAFGVIAAMLR